MRFKRDLLIALGEGKEVEGLELVEVLTQELTPDEGPVLQFTEIAFKFDGETYCYLRTEGEDWEKHFARLGFESDVKQKEVTAWESERGSNGWMLSSRYIDEEAVR